MTFQFEISERAAPASAFHIPLSEHHAGESVWFRHRHRHRHRLPLQGRRQRNWTRRRRIGHSIEAQGNSSTVPEASDSRKTRKPTREFQDSGKNRKSRPVQGTERPISSPNIHSRLTAYWQQGAPATQQAAPSSQQGAAASQQSAPSPQQAAVTLQQAGVAFKAAFTADVLTSSEATLTCPCTEGVAGQHPAAGAQQLAPATQQAASGPQQGPSGQQAPSGQQPARPERAF